MLIAIVLDRPLAEAQALVNTPDAFIQALTTVDAFIQALTTVIQDKKNHPVIAQMIQPDTSDDVAPAEATTSSSRSSEATANELQKHASQHIRISNSNKDQRET